MTSKAHSPSVQGSQARLHARPAESATLADRIQVTRDRGRIVVCLVGKYRRCFPLGDDEAAYLSALLNKHLAPVTVTRVEDRQGGGRKSLACNAQTHGECVISLCGCDCHQAGRS